MDNKQAIKQLKYFKKSYIEYDKELKRRNLEALDIAIKALEQESILDKIRAELIEEKDFAYSDFERYKVEWLGVDAEYVEDELPDDDFRYGMERAIEIIDKYKAESENKKMMNGKKIEPNKIIEIVRVTEPEKYEELFSFKNCELIPVKILDGAYYSNGRVSNFWEYENLLTGKIHRGYGEFYRLYVKGE